MTTPLYGVYGASGCGRSVLPLVREQLLEQGALAERLVFVDDNPTAPSVNGHRVLDYAAFLRESATGRFVVLAIADGSTRERLAQRCAGDGIAFFEARASNVVIMDNVTLGEGAILSPFVTLASNVRIGRHFHANIYSYVEHDCVIGDFVTLAPGAQCNGNILIDDHAYVGAGAMLRQGKPGKPLVIGRGATVGMGAVVTKDVLPGVTVVGNPARILTKRSE